VFSFSRYRVSVSVPGYLHPSVHTCGSSHLLEVVFVLELVESHRHIACAPFQVCFLNHVDALALQAALLDLRPNHDVSQALVEIEKSTFSALGVGGLHDMAVARFGDYVWADCQQSPCRDDASESSSRASQSLTVLPRDDDLSTYQAIDQLDAVFMIYERMHLIPAPVIEGRKDLETFLDSFGPNFWEFAKNHFAVDKEKVRSVVQAQRNQQTDDIFIAGTRAFHTSFDGIYGERGFVGVGHRKVKASLGGNVKVMLTYGGLIKEGDMEAGDAPARRRYVTALECAHARREQRVSQLTEIPPSICRDRVGVKVTFFEKDVYDVLAGRIVATGNFQKEVRVVGNAAGMNQFMKEFLVYDRDTFKIALQFKAACNWVRQYGCDLGPHAD